MSTDRCKCKKVDEESEWLDEASTPLIKIFWRYEKDVGRNSEAFEHLQDARRRKEILTYDEMSPVKALYVLYRDPEHTYDISHHEIFMEVYEEYDREKGPVVTFGTADGTIKKVDAICGAFALDITGEQNCLPVGSHKYILKIKNTRTENITTVYRGFITIRSF